MHLLLVEDERALARAVSVILERKGHDVDVANDGDEGHDAIANGSYDGIVMDIMMPGRSGTELLSEMRAAGDETPVLLLTAKTSLDDKVNGLELGADDYLTKPFEMRELVARIDAMTRKSTAHSRRWMARHRCQSGTARHLPSSSCGEDATAR